MPIESQQRKDTEGLKAPSRVPLGTIAFSLPVLLSRVCRGWNLFYCHLPKYGDTAKETHMLNMSMFFVQHNSLVS